MRLRRKLDLAVNKAVVERRHDFERYRRELESHMQVQLKYAIAVERRNLVDEQRWRLDERGRRRQEAGLVGAGL